VFWGRRARGRLQFGKQLPASEFSPGEQGADSSRGIAPRNPTPTIGLATNAVNDTRTVAGSWQRAPRQITCAPESVKNSLPYDFHEPAKVLVADPDRDVAELLAHALRRHGYAVALACARPWSLDAWRAERPDLILLDPILQDLVGFESVSHLLEAIGAPVILVTSDDCGREVLQWVASGVRDCIRKPFSPAFLLARVHAILQR
jgi:CheY-like chemotaxis protein